MADFIDACGMRCTEKTALLGQIPASGGHTKNSISVKHRMGRTDGPGNSIMRHLSNLLGLGFGENSIGGDNT